MNKLPIKIITTGLLVGFISGCTSPAYDYRKDPVVTEITVPMSKTVKAGDTGLSVSFDKIDSDSRCPINARCVWSGVAVVAATVKNAKGESKALKLGTVNVEKINNSEQAFGKRITLLELLPQPVAGKAAKPELTQSSIKIKID
ncbi:hypothetical protein [Leucothrix pacifica]|uniref:Uncharacterized protein n=1 Tax=Leucothrix pacifica TaxID=1247513 RepID=A0A317CMN3_9GAMM|nr:hypothetical protein [Leucothrix pacifica]PWQ99796.1 hypothetical protein DKW60_04800 [Leucothrix pacifica]